MRTSDAVAIYRHLRSMAITTGEGSRVSIDERPEVVEARSRIGDGKRTR